MVSNSEVYIEQLKDGIEYNGHIYFGEKWRFNYNLICEQHITELVKQAENDLQGALGQMNIKLSSLEGKSIKPTKKIEPLFKAIICPFAVEFQVNGQTRGANETYVAGGTGSQALKMWGASASIGMSKNMYFDFNKLYPDLEENFESDF